MNNTEDFNVNKKHKDRLFRLLFGGEGNKENLLSLYNAINNTSYTNPDDLEITTIEDAIYMGMKNDVSLLISDSLSLYEHQSSYNPNMPIRGFMYFGKLYSKYIKSNKLNLYGENLIKLPAPQYIVFYNGSKMQEDTTELKLSDSFVDKSAGNRFEWTATVININYGRNKELMEKCNTLKEYSILVDKIKRYTKIYEDLKQAIDIAVTECISEGILEDFLVKHRAEVIDVCITEYDEEETLNSIRNESFDKGRDIGKKEGIDIGKKEGIDIGKKEGIDIGKKEGIDIGKKEGIDIGKKQIICVLVRDGILDPKKAAEKLGLTAEELKNMMNNIEE